MNRWLPPRISSLLEALHRARSAIVGRIRTENFEDGWENRIDRGRFREELYARAKIGSG